MLGSYKASAENEPLLKVKIAELDQELKHVRNEMDEKNEHVKKSRDDMQHLVRSCLIIKNKCKALKDDINDVIDPCRSMQSDINKFKASVISQCAQYHTTFLGILAKHRHANARIIHLESSIVQAEEAHRTTMTVLTSSLQESEAQNAALQSLLSDRTTQQQHEYRSFKATCEQLESKIELLESSLIECNSSRKTTEDQTHRV